MVVGLPAAMLPMAVLTFQNIARFAVGTTNIYDFEDCHDCHTDFKDGVQFTDEYLAVVFQYHVESCVFQVGLRRSSTLFLSLRPIVCPSDPAFFLPSASSSNDLLGRTQLFGNL